MILVVDPNGRTLFSCLQTAVRLGEGAFRAETVRELSAEHGDEQSTVSEAATVLDSG